MTNQDKDITPAILLQHIQEMKKDLKQDIKDLSKKMDSRFDGVEKRLEHLEQDVFVLISRKKAHEETLGKIEKVKLPKIRKSVKNISRKLSDHIASARPHPALQA